ncbi:MAG: hypothetical protein ACE5I5_06570 [Candidatus Heimdallarchaeota archaeon]
METKEFETNEKFLRIGIARTDIDAMNLELHENGIANVCDRIKKGELPLSIVVEDPSVIVTRFKTVYERFRNRLLFTGA